MATRAIPRGGGPRGGDSDTDLFDLRFARRSARARLKLGKPVSSIVAWTLSPEWTCVATRGYGFRGLAVLRHGQIQGNHVSGEVANDTIIVSLYL